MPPFVHPPSPSAFAMILASCIATFGPFVGPIIALGIAVALGQ